MKKLLITLCCTFALMSQVFALDAGDQVKMVLAKQKLYAGQYVEALNIYKEVLQKNPEDATVLYYVGYCNYELKKYDVAEEHFKKAASKTKDVIPETHFYLGKIYLADAKIDEATSSFMQYKSVAKFNIDAKKMEYQVNDLAVYLAYCENAKKFIASPIDVKVENLGAVINSKYADKTPCITADGRKLVFTSRRPETTDSPRDKEGDGDFFEDIYISLWDTINRKWLTPESAPGNINTDAHDAATSISPDGKQIFIYKNDINDVQSRGGDIFVSKIVSNKWKTPEPMGKQINTSYFEGGACISPDGKTLYFSSERKGGLGHSDIWMAKRISKTEWGKAVNLVDINSEYDEVGVFLAPDGKTMFFSTDGKGSMGSYDVFKSTLVGDKWSKPENVGYPINSVNKDGPLVVSADAKMAYIASDRKGGLGESDIYSVDLTNYGIFEKDGKKKTNDGLSILKGTIRDGFEGSGIASVDIKIMDATGALIATTVTNDNGEYFITLKGDVSYTLNIVKKGYKTVNEKVDLKLGKNEAFSLEKQIMLTKEK